MSISPKSWSFQLVFSLLTALSLQGCATATLWKYEPVSIESDPVLVGKANELIFNIKDNKICIPFSSEESVQHNQYLIAEVGDDYHLDLLRDILLNEPAFNIRSVVVNAQDCSKIKSGSYRSLGIYLFGNVSDDSIVFEKDNLEYNVLPTKINTSHPASELLAASSVFCTNIREPITKIKSIINEKWTKTFGEQFKGSIYPIACINKKGDVINYGGKDLAGFVNELVPPLNGIKYVEIKFNMKKYEFMSVGTYGSNHWYPMAIRNYTNEYLFYFYFDEPYQGYKWHLPNKIKEYHYSHDTNACSGDSVKILSDNMPINIYHNTIEEKKEYSNSLAARAFSTPFTLAFDIVTSPIQLGVLVYIVFIHGMP
jgi:hypothetical protein